MSQRPAKPPFSLLVEGMVDEAAGRRLVETAGGTVGDVYGRRGASYIRTKLRGFARSSSDDRPLVALVDFIDTREECPPGVRSAWLGDGFEAVVLNVVVAEIESWVLADSAGVAGFFRLPLHRVPSEPEGLRDPKLALVNMVRHHSRSRELIDTMVPAPGTSAPQGPGYNEVVARFVRQAWNPTTASDRRQDPAETLGRLVQRHHRADLRAAHPATRRRTARSQPRAAR